MKHKVFRRRVNPIQNLADNCILGGNQHPIYTGILIISQNSFSYRGFTSSIGVKLIPFHAIWRLSRYKLGFYLAAACTTCDQNIPRPSSFSTKGIGMRIIWLKPKLLHNGAHVPRKNKQILKYIFKPDIFVSSSQDLDFQSTTLRHEIICGIFMAVSMDIADYTLRIGS